MRKTLIVASVLAAAGVMATEANARQRVVDVTPSNRQCFTIDYVPQLVRVDTRGRLVQREGRSTTYNITHNVGGTAVIQRNPAIFMERRTVVEQDHYTMRPAACP
jgi:hypothetical protein